MSAVSKERSTAGSVRRRRRSVSPLLCRMLGLGRCWTPRTRLSMGDAADGLVDESRGGLSSHRRRCRLPKARRRVPLADSLPLGRKAVAALLMWWLVLTRRPPRIRPSGAARARSHARVHAGSSRSGGSFCEELAALLKASPHERCFKGAQQECGCCRSTAQSRGSQPTGALRREELALQHGRFQTRRLSMVMQGAPLPGGGRVERRRIQRCHLLCH